MYAVEAVVVIFEKNYKELEVSVQVPGRGVTLELNTEAQIRHFDATVLGSESYFDILALTLPADVA